MQQLSLKTCDVHTLSRVDGSLWSSDYRFWSKSDSPRCWGWKTQTKRLISNQGHEKKFDMTKLNNNFDDENYIIFSQQVVIAFFSLNFKLFSSRMRKRNTPQYHEKQSTWHNSSHRKHSLLQIQGEDAGRYSQHVEEVDESPEESCNRGKIERLSVTNRAIWRKKKHLLLILLKKYTISQLTTIVAHYLS